MYLRLGGTGEVDVGLNSIPTTLASQSWLLAMPTRRPWRPRKSGTAFILPRSTTRTGLLERLPRCAIQPELCERNAAASSPAAVVSVLPGRSYPRPFRLQSVSKSATAAKCAGAGTCNTRSEATLASRCYFWLLNGLLLDPWDPLASAV